MKSKFILQIFVLLVLFLNTFALMAVTSTPEFVIFGFDTGGGPSMKIEVVMDFLESDTSKGMIEGLFLRDSDNKNVILSTYQKSDSFENTDSIWKNIIHEDEKYLLVRLSFDDNNQRAIFIIFKFEEYEIVDGNLTFNLEKSTNVFQLYINQNKLTKIDFNKFIDELCELEKCPNVHFIVSE